LHFLWLLGPKLQLPFESYSPDREGEFASGPYTAGERFPAPLYPWRSPPLEGIVPLADEQ
jgi:hypothetical protein